MITPAGLLVDIDGVLVVAWQALPGIPEAFTELRSHRIPMRLATNTTAYSRAEIAGLLGNEGIEVDRSHILTAPSATAAYLRREHPGARCLLLNEGDPSDDMEGVDLTDDGSADVVLIGGAGPVFSYDALNRAFDRLSGGAALVVMHRNLAWRTADGMQLDSGGYVTALEAATGVRATVAGKPAPVFFASGLQALGLPGNRVAMVGDDLVNDVLAAQDCGITGVLVRTGKFTAQSLREAKRQPDAVVDSFAEIPRWLELR
ncbi:MAG: HAD-IIA family hydrolase [Acidimicrobiia bacterium]|nr:MAG: HAD-IIA family hydrolase [Acidimicrobiia bacterium]